MISISIIYIIFTYIVISTPWLFSICVKWQETTSLFLWAVHTRSQRNSRKFSFLPLALYLSLFLSLSHAQNKPNKCKAMKEEKYRMNLEWKLEACARARARENVTRGVLLSLAYTNAYTKHTKQTISFSNLWCAAQLCWKCLYTIFKLF